MSETTGSTEEREAVALNVAEATDLECLIMEICGDVAELPDRTSPEDQPDMMLVNFEELQIILSNRIAPFVAAEILAAEANERARLVDFTRHEPDGWQCGVCESAWQTSDEADACCPTARAALTANHSATDEQSGVPVPSNHEGVNLVALCLAMARIKELDAALNGIVPSPLCGESWNLPDKETVQITVTFGALKAARLALTNSINVATS